MYKRIISAVLSAVLLISLALSAHAVETQEEAVTHHIIRISTPEEFLKFAENCRLDSYSLGALVFLEKDIDLSGVAFESVPIFAGTFLGEGHTISGLNITRNGSAQGLFRYLTATAVVKNLNVTGVIHPGGSRNEIGAIAGCNEGQILGCSFSGSVSGGDYVGGMVGTNGVTGIVEDCRVEGVLQGNHFVGGIAGENHGVIRSCKNAALVNTTPQQNSVELSDITLDTLTNTESASTVTDIGGIAGTSSGVIRLCENRGSVGYRHMGYNIGGIAGTQSGYILECRNDAAVQGRKEVGGIAGQMEPVSKIEYSMDTLQILKGQLGTMSTLADNAVSNAYAGASNIGGQLEILQDQVYVAWDAVDALLHDTDTPSLPDADIILAAQNSLASSLGAMPGTLQSISNATQNLAYTLSRDMRAISNQVSAMGETINNAAETLGGSITDVSDQDTPEMLTGKVENCRNLGNILADLNAGGITGAIALENDMDVLEDWEQYGEQSLNFESEVRAVVLSCENQGAVTVKKQNGGGIVGWQSLGLVKNSSNTGTLDAAGADYVGGISGLSTGYIRSNFAKCQLFGSVRVGGIAGSGTVVTDCLSVTDILGGSEKLGAVLGEVEESLSEEEHPIGGNFYLRVSRDLGAIDGISYASAAEPLELEAFLALESLPDLLRTVSVRFLFEDGTAEEFTVPLSRAFSDKRIPALPEKEGHTGAWKNIETTDFSQMYFDVSFEPVYTPYQTTIQSGELGQNGRPVLLVQGVFSEDAVVAVSESAAAPVLSGGESLVNAWTLEISERADSMTCRVLAGDSAGLKLMVLGEDGQWKERAYTADGSYLVFTLMDGEAQIAILRTQMDSLLWAAAGVLVLLLAVSVVLIRRKKDKG